MKKLSAVIICWEGKEDNAYNIAGQVKSKVDKLFVIYSNSTNKIINGPGIWHQVPNDWFFGKKFSKALELSSGDRLLLIHADAFADNWGVLVEKFKHALQSIPCLGLWSPEIHWTHWDTASVEICKIDGSHYSSVAQSDGIVLGISEKVLARLKGLEYEDNNLGWGIDWLAIAFCYINGLLVLRDLSINIFHPQTSGYDNEQAAQQMNKFLLQLTMPEKNMMLLLQQFINQKRFLAQPLLSKSNAS